MVVVLAVPKYCVGVFNYNFCEISNLKYFLFCVMLPTLIGLFVWWVPDIVRALCPNKCIAKPAQNISIKNIFNEIISKQDIEKFIGAAIIMGIQKFAATHPKTAAAFDDIMNALHKDKK